MRRVYLDHNATTPLAPEVFEAMKPYWLEDYGNASSVHWYGQRAKAAVEAARVEVARLINADPSEVVFTSGGTESDNTAVFGAVDAAPREANGKKHVVTTSIEHHAVLHAARALERRGFEVTYLPVGSSGTLDPEDVERAIRPHTVLISVMHANNELGTIQPLEEIGRMARERGITFHSDAVQSAGKIPVDVRQLGLDLLSLSAHKLYGPKGVGALYVRKGTALRPLLYGGHHERDRRPGTENVPGIVGLGKAASLARERLDEEAARLGTLRDDLEESVFDRIPTVAVNGDSKRRLPTTTNLRFDGVDSSTAAAILAESNSLASGEAPGASSQGAEAVVGLTMQLWNQRRLQGLEEGAGTPGHASGRCCSLDDVYDARRVASFLGIP